MCNMYTQKHIQLPSSIEQEDKYFVIVGFALNGPVDRPFMIRDGVNPYDVLGNCPMAESYIIAKSRGVSPLLLRVNGSHSSNVLELSSGVDVAKFISVEATDECNQIRVSVYSTHIKVTGMLGAQRYYLFSDYPTIGKMKDAINFDAYYGNGEITMVSYDDDVLCSSVVTENPFDIWLNLGDDGADTVASLDGTDSQETIDKQINLIRASLLDEETNLEGQYSYSHGGELTPFNIDTVIVPDIPFENSRLIAEIMGKFCESKSSDQDSFCSCVLGSMHFAEEESEEYSYDSMVQDLISKGASTNVESYYLNTEVVLGVEEGNVEGSKIPMATKFAVMRYLLPVYLSATNKEIADINTLFTTLRKEHIASLAASGYICIVPSIRRGFVAYKSLAFVANQELITSKPHFSRASRHYANYIIGSLDNFIGEPANTLQLNAMEQLLSANIEELNRLDIFKHIEYLISMSPTQANEVKLQLTFVIYGEVEAIRTSASYDPIRKTVIAWS